MLRSLISDGGAVRLYFATREPVIGVMKLASVPLLVRFQRKFLQLVNARRNLMAEDRSRSGEIAWCDIRSRINSAGQLTSSYRATVI